MIIKNEQKKSSSFHIDRSWKRTKNAEDAIA